MTEIIPMVESNYRTLTDRENRAIAGLSMGAGQAVQIGTKHLDKFSAIAGFSGGGSADVQNGYNGAMRDAEAFNRDPSAPPPSGVGPIPARAPPRRKTPDLPPSLQSGKS